MQHSRHLSDGLADLARADERRRDAALLRATTELFLLDVAHDSDEIRRYEELATHFLPKVSVADRAFVAERLSICPDAPAAVVRMLARDVIEVAAPVLRYSAALAAVELLSVIAATGVEHHRLLARRATLPSEVARGLWLTGDPDVLASLEDGPAIASARQSANASQPADEYYGSNRLDAWRFLALDRKARLRLIAEIAGRPATRNHGLGNQRLERAFRSILNAAQIAGYARSGNSSAIIGGISDGLELPSDLVAAAVSDASGELLAIMLKALRLDDIQARQVFLLASPAGRDVNAFFPLSDLYASMEPAVAEVLTSAWRETGRERAAGHTPHLAENGARRPLPNAHPAPAARPEEQARRA